MYFLSTSGVRVFFRISMTNCRKWIATRKNWTNFSKFNSGGCHKGLKDSTTRWQWESEKNHWEKQVYTCITHFFCTFLCRFCATTKWNCLILRFMEEVSDERRNFLSLSELEYNPWEFSSRGFAKNSRLPLLRRNSLAYRDFKIQGRNGSKNVA